MEARLSQHICFKTAKKKRAASPEFERRNPAFRIEDEENDSPMDFINEDSPSCVLTPPALKSQVPGKSFLFLPKMDNRARLTSTPNQDQPKTGVCASDYIDEAFSFSPTGFSTRDNLRKPPCIDEEGDVEGIRSVLFPSRHTQKLKSSQSDDSAIFSPGNNSGKSSRTSKKKSSSTAMNSSQTRERRSCMERRTSLTIYKEEWQVQSLQESGFGSLVGDSYSQFGENSLPSSPLKRRAQDNGSMTSLESPMKRLAFVSMDIQPHALTPINFHDDVSKNNSSQPGSSFLNNRALASECEEALCDEYLPPPIFANSIPFISPVKDSASSLDFTNSFGLKDASPAGDFQFAKPSVRPLKAKGQMKEKYMFTTSDPVSGSHAGERYFDIVQGLAERNLHHVIAKIFKGIRQKDVLRCSRVSQPWASICEENKFTRVTIKSLKKQYRNEECNRGSENFNAKDAIKSALLKSPAKLGSVRNLSSGRSALGNLQARAKRTPTKEVFMPKTPSGKNHFVPAESKYEHHQGVKRSLSFGETTTSCPWCRWTAKVYDGNDHKGQCYRLECRHTFCTLCGMKHHSPHPCKAKVSTSPKDEEKAVKAGSKKSKARLKKRLLL